MKGEGRKCISSGKITVHLPACLRPPSPSPLLCMDNIVITPSTPFISFSWRVTSWTDCSRSCGRGVQTRDVRCLMKINANEYVAGTNCSANNKPNITNLLKYCNSIPCDSDWDTEDGFVVSSSIAYQVSFLFLSCAFLFL